MVPVISRLSNARPPVAADRSAFSQSMRATLAPICAQRQPLAGRRPCRIADGRLNRIPRDQLAEAAFTRNRRHRERKRGDPAFPPPRSDQKRQPFRNRARQWKDRIATALRASRGRRQTSRPVNASLPPPLDGNRAAARRLSNNCFWKTGIRASLFPGRRIGDAPRAKAERNLAWTVSLRHYVFTAAVRARGDGEGVAENRA